MKNYKGPEYWFEWLEEQSKTGHIYSLLFSSLPADFKPVAGDFVVLHPDDLLYIRQFITELDYQASRRKLIILNGTKYALLKNRHLTEYLEMAKDLIAVKDDAGNGYIRLVFTRPAWQNDDDDPYHDVWYWDEQETDETLKMCWELLVAGKDRRQALKYAKAGEALLLQRLEALLQGEGTFPELCEVLQGFNILANAYAWNNCFKDALRCDDQYIFKQYLWADLQKEIKGYLELLMIKKRTRYLDQLFANEDFRDYFIVHYEAHRSLKDPLFEMTQMQEVVPVLNRVSNGKNYR